MSTQELRQVIYHSVATGRVDADAILQSSRHNNALDGISGLLWINGSVFVQALEGPQASVASALERIRADRRHRDVTILSDRLIDERDFGAWTMELSHHLDTRDEVRRRLIRRVGNLPPDLQELFD